MKKETIYSGDVEIASSNYKQWEEKLFGIEKIIGNLSIYSNASLKADSLKTVVGDLYISSNASLKADSLNTVSGNLYIYSNASLDSLKTVGGYLSISSNASIDSLKTVGGYLSISSNASLKADSLKTVSGNLSISSNASLDSLKTVVGDLSIYSNASLKADSLKTVGGDLYISSNASLKADSLKTVVRNLYIYSKLEEKLEKRLWKNNRNNKWILNQNSSEFLISQEGNIEYQINNVYFSKELFDDVRLGKLSAEKVFSLSNIEQRRVAYELMDKMKMKSLPGFKTLDEVVDKYGNKMRIISFTINGFSTPFKYLNCFCPSTKREYFIETKQDKCKFAKAKSFGLDAISFDEEW